MTKDTEAPKASKLRIQSPAKGVHLIGLDSLTNEGVRVPIDSLINGEVLFSQEDKIKLDAIESQATRDLTSEEIKNAYESNPNTNAFTDAEKRKLKNIKDLEADKTTTDSVKTAGAVMVSDKSADNFSFVSKDVNGDVNKIPTSSAVKSFVSNLVEPLAKSSDIPKSLRDLGVDDVELRKAISKVNLIPEDADKTTPEKVKGSGAVMSNQESTEGLKFVGSGKKQLPTNEVVDTKIKSSLPKSLQDLRVELTQESLEKITNFLSSIEEGATKDQTREEIKALYESNGNTNALTDELKKKLDSVEAGAEKLTGEKLKKLGVITTSQDALQAKFVTETIDSSSKKIPTSQAVFSFFEEKSPKRLSDLDISALEPFIEKVKDIESGADKTTKESVSNAGAVMSTRESVDGLSFVANSLDVDTKLPTSSAIKSYVDRLVPKKLSDLSDVSISGQEIEELLKVTKQYSLESGKVAVPISAKTATTTGFTFVLDELDLKSNSNTKLPTQRSVKAYIDAEVHKATTGLLEKINDLEKKLLEAKIELLSSQKKK